MYCRLGRRYGWHLSNLMEASVFASLSCSVWHREINWRRIGGHSSPPSFHPPSYLRASFKPKKATCQIVPSKFFIRLPLFSMLDAKQKAEEGMSKSLLNHVQSQHQKCKVPIAYFFFMLKGPAKSPWQFEEISMIGSFPDFPSVKLSTSSSSSSQK